MSRPTDISAIRLTVVFYYIPLIEAIKLLRASAFSLLLLLRIQTRLNERINRGQMLKAIARPGAG